MNDGSTDNAFDAAMRQRYRLASGRVSPGTLTRLRPRPRALGPALAWAPGWRVGAGMAGIAAAMFAVTVGLNLHRPPAPPVASPPLAGDAAWAPDPVGTLEQDPDFYAWLASEDADMLAVE
jgi:hypothetical protein